MAKHPELMQLAKERDIAIEINPLSNQVRLDHKKHTFLLRVRVSVDADVQR